MSKKHGNGNGNGHGKDDPSFVYLRHIAPIVDHLKNTCRKHNICMLAAFSVPLTEEAGVIMLNILPDKTGRIPHEFGEAHRLLQAKPGNQDAG